MRITIINKKIISMLAFEIKISSIKDNKRDFGTFKREICTMF